MGGSRKDDSMVLHALENICMTTRNIPHHYFCFYMFFSYLTDVPKI